MTAPAFRPAPDPDATVRLDPAAEADQYGLCIDEVGPAEDRVGWDLHFGARLNFGDDLQFGDGRGLHYLLSIGPDLPPQATVIKTITATQLRAFGESLIALADRAGARRPAGAPHQAAAR